MWALLISAASLVHTGGPILLPLETLSRVGVAAAFANGPMPTRPPFVVLANFLLDGCLGWLGGFLGFLGFLGLLGLLGFLRFLGLLGL